MEWKGMILSTFGGDEDSGLAGPKGFTAERGGSNTNAHYTEDHFRQLLVDIEAGESRLKSVRHLGGALLF
jgi:hypothetical protein